MPCKPAMARQPPEEMKKRFEAFVDRLTGDEDPAKVRIPSGVMR